MKRTLTLLLPACTLFLAAALPLRAQQDHKKWSDYGGGPDSSHFTNLTQITPSNVNQLEVAWTYPTRDRISYLFNPIIVDKTMYVLARNYSLVALDAETGKELYSSGEQIASFAHFGGLSVANGRVYLGTYDSVLYCFGLPQ